MLHNTPQLLYVPKNPVVVAAGGDAAETTAFLVRADAITTVGVTERAAYKALINGLVSDGVFAKLDALYIFATDTSAHALLNLVSASFNASLVTTNGSPAFVADRGFTPNNPGAPGSYIDSNFNPSTAGGLFTQNAAHISAWSNTTGAGAAGIIGFDPTGATAIYPNFSSSDTYIRVNDSSPSGQVGTTAGLGWYMGSRTSSSNRDAYNNNTSLGNTPSATSVAMVNETIVIGAAGAGFNVTNKQISQASFGGSLSPTDAANFYSRLRTYMTAVGVP